MSEEMKRRSVIIDPQRMHLAEFERQDWIVNAEEGTLISDIVDPGYWAHMAAQMKPYDRIEVRLETGEWIAEVLVLSTDRNWAKVHLLVKYDIAPELVNSISPLQHAVEWKGVQKKHCVIRKSDQKIVQEGFEDKNKALQWLANHERAA